MGIHGILHTISAMTILLIEDEASLAGHVARTLTLADHEVTHCCR